MSVKLLAEITIIILDGYFVFRLYIASVPHKQDSLGSLFSPSPSAGNVPGAYNGGLVCVRCQFRPCSAYDTTRPLSIRDRYAFEFQARPPGFDGNLCDTLLPATILRLTFMPRSREAPELKIPLADSVRRNHAIEHATVTLMLERGMRVPMGGYSISPGFIIWSRASPEDVALAARDALDLLKAGNSELAISPYCGTNIVSFVVVGALAAKIFAGSNKGVWSILRGAAAALLAAVLLGRPLGRLIQRHFTTLPDVEGVELVEIRELLRTPVSIVWVRTSLDVN